MKRLLLLALVVLGLAGSASATTLGFGCIGGGSVACGVGEVQLSLDVTDSGNGTVTLTLRNVGPAASAIANVYLDEPFEFGTASLIQSAGVSFKRGGSPKKLPGGNTVGFVGEIRFAANAPKPQRGVNPGESLSIVLTLTGGKTYADVVSALSSGEMRVGVHLIGVSDPGCTGKRDFCDTSASLVNRPGDVPEPAVAALLGVAALLAAAATRRRALR
jgi:hypothetical protein